MQFEFATATRIIFGPQTLGQVAPEAASMGKRALVVTEPSPVRAVPLMEQLADEGIEVLTFGVPGEPTTSLVTEGVREASQAGCDILIGLGGGSVLDTAKAIAALITNGGDLLDYLEVIGRGLPLAKPSLPTITIPTTAGTGSEVTRNAVLSSTEEHVKVSLRSPLMLPRLAVVDSRLTHSMPPALTASTGLDALTQLIEPYVCIKANPMTDGLCTEGMERAARSLRRVCQDGNDASAREDMSLASLFGGLSLANAGLGAVHGFAAPIGGMYSAPHGAVCARLLPHVMQANVEALRAREPSSPVITRYQHIARTLTGRASATAEEGVEWVHTLCSDLAVPPLASYGLTGEAVPAVVAAARKASSMKGNPIALTDEELTEILVRAL